MELHGAFGKFAECEIYHTQTEFYMKSNLFSIYLIVIDRSNYKCSQARANFHSAIGCPSKRMHLLRLK